MTKRKLSTRPTQAPRTRLLPLFGHVLLLDRFQIATETVIRDFPFDSSSSFAIIFVLACSETNQIVYAMCNSISSVWEKSRRASE